MQSALPTPIKEALRSKFLLVHLCMPPKQDRRFRESLTEWDITARVHNNDHTRGGENTAYLLPVHGNHGKRVRRRAGGE